ncbi:hypothetical protein [Anaerotignum lactatifermentans]|uniref:hypothetical protein n=1 Tax=Anaerotignum lactatifermentans TaxID=160404 RepID=UPI00174CECCF|nr:hypothetical protein [Anaerotignum lactatifermentans]
MDTVTDSQQEAAGGKLTRARGTARGAIGQGIRAHRGAYKGKEKECRRSGHPL